MPITLHIPPDNHHAVIHAVLHIRRRRVRWVPSVTSGILFTFSAVLFALAAVLETPTALVTASLAFVLGMFFAIWPRRIRAAVERRMAKLPEHARTVTVSETGLTSVAPLANSSFEWAYVTSAVETEEVFVLLRFRTIVSVLPKAVFGAGEADEFRALLAGRGLVPA